MINIPSDKLKEFLLRDNLISEADFNHKAEEAKRLGTSVSDVLLSEKIISEDYLKEIAALYLGVPLARLTAAAIDPEVLFLLPEDIARQKRIILFRREADGRIAAAMEDPSNLVDREFLENYLKTKINPYLASSDELNKGFSLYGQRQARNFKQVIEENIAASLKSKVKGEKEAATEVPIVAIVDNLLSYAMALRASDIHLEVFADFVLIRYRIDGILHEIMRIPKEVHAAIVARIKLLGGLKLDEHLKPQDGRFRYQIGSEVIDVRIAVMPTYYGEKLELRLLPAATRPLSFSELGMLEDTARLLEENIKKSYGMVLVTGPTGSGKTTTLYSILNVLNRPEINIVTIEDPIEYDIKFINQTQVNPQAGVTFANGLRAILRQDPNVIMVGEIRDEETAEIAVQSALTGHLVLSSLHTNDAPTAVPRLIDMKIPPFLVAAVLNAIVAQRLVRRIHLACIESYQPDEATLEAIYAQLKELGLEPSEVHLPQLFYRGRGCAADNFTGYEGRVGIFEVLNVTEEIRKLIISPDFSLDNLRTLARKEGMITMFEDGLRKVATGITSINELLRVIRE
jgi:type IV pilus assembly protein PilB